MPDENTAAPDAAPEALPTPAEQLEDPPTFGGTPDPNPPTGTEAPAMTDEERDAWLAQEVANRKAEQTKLRAETPHQCVMLRGEPGCHQAGVVVATPDGVRCFPLADFRTDVVRLQAGDSVYIFVLVGEGLEAFEHYQRVEKAQEQAKINQAALDAQLGNVATVSLAPEQAAAVLSGAATGTGEG